MKTRTKHTREVLFFCLLSLVVSLAACSRQEPAKAVKTVPKASLVSSNELSRIPVSLTVPTTIAVQTNIPKHMPPSSVRTPESRQALQEQQKAMRERQQVLLKKAIEDEIQRMEGTIEKLTSQMQAIEMVADSNETVKVARQDVLSRRKEYDHERIQLPGMVDLWKSREAEKTRLVTIKAQPETPEREKAVAEARSEINRLGRMMIDIEVGARTNSLSFQKSIENMRTAEAGLGTSFMTLDEYKELAVRRQKLQDECTDLKSRLADFLKREQK